MASILHRLSRPTPERSGGEGSTEYIVLATTDDLETTPSLTMSNTPPTSTDSASDVLDAPVPSRSRSTRAAPKDLLSHAKQGSKAAHGHRDISGETLVEDPSGEPIQSLLGDGIKALDLEWTVDALPGEDPARAQTKLQEGLKRRHSTRLELVDKVKDSVSSRLSVLGKRGREVKSDAAEKIHDLKRRASLRPRTAEKTEELGAPAAKRLKPNGSVKINKADISAPLEAAKLGPKANPVPKKKKEKFWLSRGLYVGQDRAFDGRLTEAKNKAKIQAEGEGSSMPKERSVLPMPMFFGEKLLKAGRDFKLPYDVFSPLPPGQPKPDEWKKCRKNVFIGDAASIWKDTVLREVSRCLCTEETGCDENCLNRYMLYECDDTNCNLGEEKCTNRAFADLKARTKTGRKYDIGVEVMKTFNKGYGVRANRTFEPGQIIVEYAGEIITQDECDDRMDKLYKDNECYYLMLFDQNMIIDATRGSIARFINHSCEPNCRMIKWTVAGKPRMALFAGDKGVMTGDELTYDYKFEAFSIKNDQACHCGSSKCRGSLGGRPKEVPKEVKPAPSTLKASKKKVRTMLQQASTTQAKKGKFLGKSIVRVSKSKVTKLRTTKPSAKAKEGRSAAPTKRNGRETASRAVASVRRNVVTTVRGPRRAAAMKRNGGEVMANESGSTIRIIDNV
ncbi:MAG: hypothetical protein M1814_000598 [Vezdaea aestivalis]|nr:MAG: hypothetical protein M1814_000598 [Vezdaea aestivalis]